MPRTFFFPPDARGVIANFSPRRAGLARCSDGSGVSRAATIRPRLRVPVGFRDRGKIKGAMRHHLPGVTAVFLEAAYAVVQSLIGSPEV